MVYFRLYELVIGGGIDMRRKANRKVQSGIYEIRNSVNDKIYIGSSIDIEQRWYDHKRKLRNGNHHYA
tara:strand:- start:451 stop:654 length:204 start_codon:yes stop_codon:yes gene_type:complete